MNDITITQKKDADSLAIHGENGTQDEKSEEYEMVSYERIHLVLRLIILHSIQNCTSLLAGMLF